MKLFLLLPFILASCAKHHDDPTPTPAEQSTVEKFADAEDRLLDMAPQGWVESRNPDGSPAHLGDSLIWSGIALGTLDCERGNKIEDAMVSMIEEKQGKIYRHPTLKDDVSLDGALGLWYGISQRSTKCEGAKERWQSVLSKNPSFFEGYLNDQSSTTVPLHFPYLRQSLCHSLGICKAPPSFSAALLGNELIAWAKLVKETRSSCYRIHLAYRSFRILEVLGAPLSTNSRNAFCDVVGKLDIPLVQYYCGNPPALDNYVSTFQFNQWEYRHQRCGDWEVPDGNGDETAGLDYLDAVRERYALPYE